jgi:hypothetical protein
VTTLPTAQAVAERSLAIAIGYIGENRTDDLPEIDEWLQVEGDDAPLDPFCAAYVSWDRAKALAQLLGVAFTPETIVSVLKADILPVLSAHYLAPSASCGAIMRDAQAKGIWLSVAAMGDNVSLLPGWLALFCWNGSGTPEHIGFVEQDLGDTIGTVEGNTSDASNANGGTVARKIRSLQFVVGFVKTY